MKKPSGDSERVKSNKNLKKKGKSMAIIPGKKNTSNTKDTSLPEANKHSSVNVGQTERLISMIGGAGLATYGLLRRDWIGGLLGVTGAGLLLRGASGRSPVYKLLGQNTAQSEDGVEQLSTNVTTLPGKNGIQVQRALTINRTPEELYEFWKQVEKAPLYTPHVESVIKTGERTSHWLAPGPSDKTIEWNSEILQDQPNSLIAWHIHGKGPVANSGVVTFEKATGGRGTVVTLELKYFDRMPMFKALSKLTWRIPEYETLETLRRFKEVMEAGEVPTTKGQPTGNGRK